MVVARVSYLGPDNPSFESTRSAQKRLWDEGIAVEGPDTDTLTGDNRQDSGKGVHFSRKGAIAHGKLWFENVSTYLDRVSMPVGVSRSSAATNDQMTWNAAEGFSAMDNPIGVWTYGFGGNGRLTALFNGRTNDWLHSDWVSPVSGWYMSTGEPCEQWAPGGMGKSNGSFKAIADWIEKHV